MLMIFTAMPGCNTHESKTRKITIDQSFIDSIKTAADTSYGKTQYTSNFAWANYYGNRADSTLMQLMKGSDSLIKQVIVTRNNKRIYFAQYYDNGQLKGEYEFDEYGSNKGPSKEYFENGHVKEEGSYKAGFRTGEWKVYDSTGKTIETLKYDENGQVEVK